MQRREKRSVKAALKIKADDPPHDAILGYRSEIDKARQAGLSDRQIRDDFVEQAVFHAEESRTRGMPLEAVERGLDVALSVLDSLLGEPSSAIDA